MTKPDRPRYIDGWDFQDQGTDLIERKTKAHWELNKHLYEDASQNLKGLCMLRIALNWWEDPAIRQHRQTLVDKYQFRGTIDMMEFYAKTVGAKI